MRLFKWVCAAAVAWAAVAGAQGFGKSQIRNEKFAWRILPTEHLDVYYYEEEAFLASWAAEVAEDAYDRIADEWSVDSQRRIPVIIFMSARHFEQNNILPVSGEGTGGFSEPLRRRLVMPYTGSQRLFEQTMTHEMAHIMEFEILFPTFGAAISSISPPDWFMEGAPEHLADDWNPEGEMVVRDAVMSENVPDLKDLANFGYLPDPYLGYKLGQSCMDYLAETYGDDAAIKLLRAFEKSTLRRPDDALDDAFGVKLDDLNEDWKVWLKQRYWPLIGAKAQLKDFASQLTPKEDRRKYISYFKPQWSPSGELVACLSVKERFLDIFLVNAKTGKKFENLTKGFSLSKYEYIMYLQNGLSWSPDGNFITFVGKKDTYDQIFILNALTGRVVRRYNPKFEDIVAPVYSPDGKKIAFAGIVRDKQEIYVLDVASGEVTPVTKDFYGDGYPAWSPDGKYIYYASERQTFHNIFRIRPDGTGEEQLTFGDAENISPAVSPDGTRMMFVSNREGGIFNIFVLDLAGRTVSQYTDVVTGVMDAAWSPDGQKIAFTAYEDSTYAVWTMPWRDEPVKPAAAEAPKPGDYGFETWLAASRGAAPAEPAPGEPAAEKPTAAELIAAARAEPPVPTSAETTTPAVGEAGAAGESGEAAEEENAEEPLETPTVRDLVVADTLAADSHKYGIKLGPDYLYTTFSYTTGGIFTNYTIFGLSDILGSHRLDLLFDLTSLGSLQDIDAEVDYYYLTRRTSYIFSALSWQDYYIASNVAFDRRLSGGSAIASYPFDMRNRVDAGLYGYDRRDRFFTDPEQPPIPVGHDNVIGGLASVVHDTSQWWGYYHPTAGSRVSYTVRQTAPVTPTSLYYTEQVLDARRYFRVSDRVSLAFRGALGADVGRDPQKFFLGGGDSLRGYDYYELYGSRFGLGTFEFRFPVLDYLVWPIEGFAIGAFRSLFFVDLGSAWGGFDPSSPYPYDHRWSTRKEDDNYDHFTFATTDGGFHLVHAKMSFGTGIRWWLGYFDMKLDWAWRTDLGSVDRSPMVHFTLGPDF